jgi:predicted dehydrogenase
MLGAFDEGRETIAAICDVDESRLAKAAEKFPEAERFTDYRKLLEQKGLDAVTVSAPDHIHAHASLLAMRAGKHVYCQKPLTRTIAEARRMREVAKQMKVATQMGIQGHSHSGSRQMVERVRAGAIGAVRELHVWTDRPIWPQGHPRPRATAAPAGLHWDLWIGPAPYREHHEGLHPFNWRGFWDFGTGALGDMACHNIDAAYWALDLGAPETVEAESSGINSETAPRWSVIRYQFPARGKLAPLKLVWYDGGKLPPAALAGGEELKSNGSLWVGDQGTLYVPDYWGEGKFLPPRSFEGLATAAPVLPRLPRGLDDHYREWLAAAKGEGEALAGFDYAGPLTEMVLLGNLALRVGKKIEWDAEKLRAKGCPEAEHFIHAEYRKGWEL